MNQTLILPIVAPLGLAITAILFKGFGRLRNAVSLVGGFGIFLAGMVLFATVRVEGIQSYRLGGWAPPFGIILGVDLLSATLVFLSGFIAFSALVYSFGYLREEKFREIFYPLFFLLWAAINGSFLTGDIFNLFVFFEVMLMSTYGLLMFMGEEEQLEASLKTMAMSLIGSTALLFAIGMLYAYTGTLNMADISVRVSGMGTPPVFYAVASLFLVVFGLKAAMVPLHFWLPDAHSSAPTPISAMLSGLLIKVGLYGMIRLFTLLFPEIRTAFEPFLLIVAGLTMLLGGVGAVAQNNFKRLLAYSSISQMGYMIMALGFFTMKSVSALVFFLINHAVVKAALFFSAGILLDTKGTLDMNKHGGFLKDAPETSWFMLVLACALAGLPPLGGFLAKFMVLQTGFLLGHYVISSVALAASFLTLFYIIRAWQKICWGKPSGRMRRAVGKRMAAPIGVLAVISIALGLFARPVIEITDEIGYQVMHPEMYIEAMGLAQTVGLEG